MKPNESHTDVRGQTTEGASPARFAEASQSCSETGYYERMQACIGRNPFSTMMLGLGVGFGLGMYLVKSMRAPSRFGSYDRRTAESLGRHMLDAMVHRLPRSFASSATTRRNW